MDQMKSLSRKRRLNKLPNLWFKIKERVRIQAKSLIPPPKRENKKLRYYHGQLLNRANHFLFIP